MSALSIVFDRTRRPLIPTVLVLVLAPTLTASADDSNEDPCPTVPPVGWVLEVGWADGSQAEALEQARANARQTLVGQLCEGYDELRCAAVKRHVRPWKEGRWKPESKKAVIGSACAAVAIKEAFTHLPDEQFIAFESDLSEVTSSVRSSVGDGLLSVEPPEWAKGCVADDLGPAVAAEIRSQLVGMSLVEPGKGDLAATQLLTTMSPRGDTVLVTLGLRDVEGKLSVVDSFDFPPSLLGIEGTELGDCRSDEELGLREGEMEGAGGLRVQVRMQTRDGVVCNGEAIEPVVQVNRQAWVQVYSVAENGDSWLVWPPPGEDGLVESTASLGEFHALKVPSFGDESLVAIAVESGSDLGSLHGWTGYCRLDGKLSPRFYPVGAAVGRATYQVWGAGVGGCKGVEHPADLAAMEGAPICGR